MILTRSPYYINAPLTTSFISGVNLKLIVNDTIENPSLVGADYEVLKNRANISVSHLDFEISNLVRDKFEYTPIFNANTGLYDSNPSNILSLNYQVDFIGSSGDYNSLRNIVLDGYGYSLEGINPTIPANKILLANDFYIVNKLGFFNIPVLNDGTNQHIYVNGQAYPVTQSNSIPSKVKNMFLNLSEFDDKIRISFGGNVINLEVVEECKYVPKDIIFLNKYGAWEIMTFFKATTESININKSTFKNNVVSNGAYNPNKHTYQDFNKNGREKLKLNSGFVPEHYNETIRQLLLSQHVFLVNNGNHIPLNIDSTSYQYKTRIQDKLISHEIDFKYGFDLINNL